MILLRKAARIATLAATALALAYYAFNHPTGTIAQWLLIIGAISISSAWASVWPAPQEDQPERMTY
jgi:hypothetical protein